jgi:hypothetical protein
MLEPSADLQMVSQYLHLRDDWGLQAFKDCDEAYLIANVLLRCSPWIWSSALHRHKVGLTFLIIIYTFNVRLSCVFGAWYLV